MAYKEQINYINKIKQTGKSNYAIEGWIMGGKSEQTSGLEIFNERKNMDANIYFKLIN